MDNVMASAEVERINSYEVILGLEIYESEVYVFYRRKIQVYGLDLKMTAYIILNGEIINYSLSEGSLVLLYHSKLIYRRLIFDWNVVSIVYDNSDAIRVKTHGRHYASTESTEYIRLYRIAEYDNFPELIWRITIDTTAINRTHFLLDRLREDRLYVLSNNSIVSFRRQNDKTTGKKKQLDMEDIMRQKEEIKRDIMNRKAATSHEDYENFKRIVDEEWNKIEASELHLREKAVYTDQLTYTVQIQTYIEHLTTEIGTQYARDMISVGTQSKPNILKLNREQMSELQSSISDKIKSVQKMLEEKLQNLRLFLEANIKYLRESHALESFQKELSKTLLPQIMSSLKPSIEDLLKQTLRQIKDAHISILNNYEIQNADESTKIRQLSRYLASSSKMITDKSVSVLREVILRLSHYRDDAMEDIRKAVEKTEETVEQIEEVVGQVQTQRVYTTDVISRLEKELDGIAELLEGRDEVNDGQTTVSGQVNGQPNTQMSTPYIPYSVPQPTPYQYPYCHYSPQYPYVASYPMYPYGQPQGMMPPPMPPPPMPPLSVPLKVNPPSPKQSPTPLSDTLIRMFEKVAKGKKYSKP